MLVSAGYVGQSLLLHRQGVRSNRILIARVTLGEKNFVWRAARAPGKSHERQILNDMHYNIKWDSMQLEVCHSTFAFHSFCHRGTELETIK